MRRLSAFDAGKMRYCLLLLITVLPFVLSGCGDKKVSYEVVSDSLKPEGRSMALSAETDDSLQTANFSVGDLESLESSGYGLSSAPDSREYRMKYGRSTPPLTPVFFEFDSAAIPVGQLQELNASGRYLLENRNVSLVVEGNCDARGSAEYNMALGDIRARNVKKHLVALGVEQERIDTLSFGAERPLFTGRSEEDWAMNRRADLVIPNRD